MLTITTTNNLDGYEVVEYLGIVTGEAVSGINMFRDIGAGLRNVFGGRSAGYEDEMAQAREEVLREMSQRAEALGANAVIGANVGYETFAEMIMTTACGTAVRVRRTSQSPRSLSHSVRSRRNGHSELPRSPSHVKTRTIQNRYRSDGPGFKVRATEQIRARAKRGARQIRAQGKTQSRATSKSSYVHVKRSACWAT